MSITKGQEAVFVEIMRLSDEAERLFDVYCQTCSECDKRIKEREEDTAIDPQIADDKVTAYRAYRAAFDEWRKQCRPSVTLEICQELTRQRAEIERLQAAANERRDKSIAWCAYCGMESKPGATVEEIREHISVCPSHPMARLQELVNDYDSRLTAARNRIEELELAARDRTTPLCGYCLLPFGKTPTPAEVAEHHKTCEAARAALSGQEGQ